MLNRDYYDKGLWKLVPKFSQIRLEMTNACGCRCFMCPRDKMTRKIGTISLDGLSTILNKLKFIDYEIGVHLHGFGEALLCKDLPERIGLVKSVNDFFKPSIITTLAYDMERGWFESLFRNGLRSVVVSVYAFDTETYRIVHGRDGFASVIQNLICLAEFRSEFDFDFRVRVDNFDVYPRGVDLRRHAENRDIFLRFLECIGYKNENVAWGKLHPFGSKSPVSGLLFKNDSGGICSIVWGHRRNILQVDWEGNVVPCCFDSNSDYKWGNLIDHSLGEIFSSDARRSFLDDMIQRQNVSMCVGCPR